MATDEARPRPPGGVPAISGHQDALDGIRALAAFAVLIFHVAADTGHTFKSGPIAWLVSGGAIGVPIFFTLSGLLLYRPWVVDLREPGGGVRRRRTRTYLWRRALRILPAYWAVTVYVMIVILHDHIGDWATWVKLLTLTYTYDPHPWWGTFLGPGGLGQIWSLTVEAAWYLILPATAAVLGRYARHGERNGPDTGRRARRLLVALSVYGASSFVFTIFLFKPHYEPQLGVWLPRYFCWFAAGMGLSVVSVWARSDPSALRFCRTVARSWGTCWTIAGVLYCMASSPLTGPSDLATPDTPWTSQFRILLYGLVAAFFVAPVALASARDTATRSILGNRAMRFFGRISYGFFLWQVAVSIGWFDLTGHAAFSGGFFIAFPPITLLTIAVATTSYYVIEQPFLRLAHRRRERRPGTAQGDEQAGDDEQAEGLREGLGEERAGVGGGELRSQGDGGRGGGGEHGGDRDPR
jgi:peptidoglycan/LPS O-acetylase OafA/YrhL